jgi:hypothetical protein
MEKVKWEKIFYDSGKIKYAGFKKYDANRKELIPSGEGIRYFETGGKHMEAKIYL